MDGFERITGREHDGLVEKCQENGWLKVGGFDWQDDPFLEEYPYEFSRTESVDRLREPRARRAGSPRPNGAREGRRGRIGTTGARRRPFSSRLEGRRGMASDYGDEAGGKLLDWMLRIGQEAGAEAMARSARELSERLAGIRGTIAGGRAEAIAADGAPTYAKLSLEELSGLPEYATIKEVVSDKLRAASVEHHIIPGGGRDWLLFKVEDAPEVDEAFRQLEQETGKAAERARERLSEIAERRQAPERLAERAERAREASRAHSQGIGRDRGPRQIEGPER